MKKLIPLLICFSVYLTAQTNSQIIEIGAGGISGISKNGIFACGSNYPSPPFLWSETTGRINLGVSDGEAYSVSNNGIVIGRFRDPNLIIGGNPVLRAGYWGNNQWNALEGMNGIPPLDDHSFTHAYGINNEGTKVVGMVWHPTWRVEACYWSIPDTGIGLLGRTGNGDSRANAISNDGSIIAGWDGIQNGPGRRAFYWDPLPHFMGGFDPTYLVGECRGMNSDGSVIVGGSVWPFIWTESTGMQHVVADSSLYWDGQALGVSDNGIIVGYVDVGGNNNRAFIKKSGWNDIIYFDEFISDSLGITGYEDWYFAFGQCISADGNRIGISGYPPGSGFLNSLILIIDNTVPVELLSFTVNINDQDILLKWSTATETNNSGFEIQKKLAGKDWEVLGFVQGSGTTTNQSNYSFNDEILTSGIYSYRLKQIDFDGSYEYSKEVSVDVEFPDDFILEQNYPNPFNPSTTISFSLPEVADVSLTIYNALGQKVTELVNSKLEAGRHSYEWNAIDATTGMYIYELRTNDFASIKKMILLK
jgi:hypothetical protein